MNKEPSPIGDGSSGYSLVPITVLQTLRQWLLYKPFTQD